MDRAATPEAIRAAYIALIKQHHPDLVRNDASGEEYARQLSHAYWALRDPKRRAEHDAELDAFDAIERQTRILYRLLYRRLRNASAQDRNVTPMRPQRLRIRAGRWIALVSIGLVVATGTLYAMRSGGVLPEVEANTERLPALPPATTRLIREAIADFEWVKLNAGSAATEGYSQACFNELASAPKLQMLDYCTAFDVAASADAPSDFFNRAHRIERFHVASSHFATDLSSHLAAIEIHTMLQRIARIQAVPPKRPFLATDDLTIHAQAIEQRYATLLGAAPAR